jgi:hypothetical protein
MISKSGMKVFFGPLEESKTWENASVARCRHVCMILEKVEAGLELESERGDARSSAGIMYSASSLSMPMRRLL